jgi:hypothetical protein
MPIHSFAFSGVVQAVVTKGEMSRLLPDSRARTILIAERPRRSLVLLFLRRYCAGAIVVPRGPVMMPRTVPIILTLDETFDRGLNTPPRGLRHRACPRSRSRSAKPPAAFGARGARGRGSFPSCAQTPG